MFPGMGIVRSVRIIAEQEPVVFFSCVIGTIGLAFPFLIGDGGRKAEADSSNYAYRIKNVYPRK